MNTIAIIPALEIMKAVTDVNIQSSGADIRRKAFDLSTDLMSKISVEVILEGALYSRISTRLNDDHKKYFESIYKIDHSVEGVNGYNISESIKWIAKSEAKNRIVIILTENLNSYQVSDPNIKVLKPNDFISKITNAEIQCNKKFFTSFNDAIISEVMK